MSNTSGKTPGGAGAAARAKASGPNRGPLIAVAIAAVVAVVLVVVAVAGKGKDPGKADSSGIAQVHPVTVTGTPLPAFESAENDKAVGTKPPELSGQSFDGSALSVVPGGKMKMVVFVAHWCPHCQAEVPRIVEWMKSATFPKQVDVIAVSTGVQPSQGNYPPSSWLAKEKFTVPTLTDDDKSTAAAAWGLSSYPYLVLVKSDGTVAARASGEMEVAALDEWVKKNLAIAS